MHNKKVAILVPTLRFGGGERVAANLINGLSHYNDLDLVVFIYDNQIDYEINNNIKIISLGENTDIQSFLTKSISFIRKIIKLRRALKENCITHTLSIMPSMNIISLLSSKNTYKIISEHNVISRNKSLTNYITNYLKLLLYRYADNVVCVSEGVSLSLIEHIPNLLPIVIYNPLDLHHIREKSQEPLNIIHKNFILGVGRLHKQKGFDLLIKALSIMKNDVNLLILGDGDQKENLENLSVKLGVSERVHILGFQENPYKYMKNAKAFVLSSRWEGFGLVLAEALTVNSNTVSYDCKSGPSEILDNGKLGALVEPNNIAQLANSVQMVLDKKITFKRAEIDQRLLEFDIEHVTKKYYLLLANS